MLTFDEAKHIYSFNGVQVPSVTQILTEAGFIDGRWYTEESRMRGTAVHAGCQFLDEGDLDMESLHPEIVPYVQAYELFKKESGFVVEHIEKRVYSATYQYAGTLDRTGELNGQDVILDIKTGQIQSWCGLQLSGYNIALGLDLHRFGLQLKDNGKYKLIPYKDPTDAQTFISAVQVVRWKQNNGVKRAA